MPKIMPLIWAGRAVAVTLVALAFTDTIPKMCIRDSPIPPLS